MGETPAKLNDRRFDHNTAAASPESESPAELSRALGFSVTGRAAALVGSALLHLITLLVLSQFIIVLHMRAESRSVVVNLRDRPAAGPSIEERLQQEIERQAKVHEVPDVPRVQPRVEKPAPEKEEADPGRGEPVAEVPTVAPMSIVGVGPGPKPSGLGGLRDRASAETRKVAVKLHGGSNDSEEAVRAALDWLKRHQDVDGGWSCSEFKANCGQPGCGGYGTMTDVDPGISGLALLAFLSGGNFPGDRGEYGDVVGRGVEYLLSIQHQSGRIGPANGHEMYNHSLGTLALAEAYVLGGEQRLRKPLESAVNYLIGAQQPNGGWDYTASRTGRNDTSITGFAVMALKSAYAAHVDVPWMVTYKIIEHFDRMTKPNAEIIYSDLGVGAGRTGVGMVAVGAVARQFLGWPLDCSLLRKQYAILAQNPPRWEMMAVNNFHTTYYWDYGTLAMFQAGGQNWELWNASLRDMLIKHQRRDGCARGSWDPDEMWLGKAAGRVYSTAINAMNLQIYYRYLPLYEEASCLNSVEALHRASETQGEMRIRAIRLLADFQGQASRESLTRALSNDDPYVRLKAAEALVERKEVAAALPSLAELSRNGNGFVRSNAVDVLLRLDQMEIVPLLIERLSDQEAFIAERAAEKLRRLCRRNISFSSGDPPEKRDLIVADWRDWWAQYVAGKVKVDSSMVIGSVSNLGESSVILDVGGRDGVKTGDDFDVYRNGRQVAVLSVHRVFEPFSFARKTDGEGVQKGDIVQRRAHN